MRTVAGLEYSAGQGDPWKIVEQRFNYRNVDTRFSFVGRLDEIGSNKRPLAFRNASMLNDY